MAQTLTLKDGTVMEFPTGASKRRYEQYLKSKEDKPKKVEMPVPCTSETLRQMDYYDIVKLVKAGKLPESSIIRNNNILLQSWIATKEYVKMGNPTAPITRVEFVRCMEALCCEIEAAKTAASYVTFDGRP